MLLPVLRTPDPDIVRRPIRVGHRGAGAHAAHNTRTSFLTALKMGVDMVETDVRPCASGELVLAHDDFIQGPRGGPVPIATTTLGELRDVDLGHGEWILLLQDLLDIARGRCTVMLDLKGEDFEENLVRTIRTARYKSAEILIPGGSRTSRDRLRQMAPEFALSLSLERFPEGGASEEFLDGIDTPAVTWHHSMIDAEMVQRLHQRGKTVYTWTVDQEEDMRRVIAAGVDGVISNRPDALNHVMRI